MEGTNTYMPVMPAGYGGGFGDGMGNGWWIILLFFSWDSVEMALVTEPMARPSVLMCSAVSIRVQ